MKKDGKLTVGFKKDSSYNVTLKMLNGTEELYVVDSTSAVSFTGSVKQGDVLTFQYSSSSSYYYGSVTAISFVPDCNHENRTPNQSKAATCTECGYENGDKCSDCGKYLGKLIPPKGHKVDDAGKCSVCGVTDTFSLFFKNVAEQISAVNDTTNGWSYTATSSISYIQSASKASGGGFTLYAKQAGELKLTGKAKYFTGVIITVNDGTLETLNPDSYSEKTITYTKQLAARDVVRIDYTSRYPSSTDAYVKFTSVGFTASVISNTYTITPSVDGEGGTISPSTAVTVDEGEDKTFTFTPNDGYELDTVKVDGAAVPVSGTSYTFTNVTANHTITVSFEQKQTAPTDYFQKFFESKTADMTAVNSTDKAWTALPSGLKYKLKASGSEEKVFTLTMKKGGYLTVKGTVSQPMAKVTAADANKKTVGTLSSTSYMPTTTAFEAQVKTGDVITFTYSSCAYADSSYYVEITDITLDTSCPHSLSQEIPAEAATCTKDGNNLYYECLVCKGKFKEKACTTPMTDVAANKTVTLTTTASASLSAFADAASVSGWAVDAVRWAVGSGLMNGTNCRIDPAGLTTRAEAAALLHRYLA